MTDAVGDGRRRARHAQGSVMNGLATIFNVIALTLCVVVVSLTVVGLPLAFSSASTALYDWRQGGEGEVMHTFWTAFRTRALHRTVVVAPAMAGTSLGVVEAIYFLHFRGPVATLCVTIGLLTVAVGVSFTAYLLLLLTVADRAAWGEIWRCAAAIVARTSLTALPVLLGETALAALVGFFEPALVVVAIPVGLLWCWQRTTLWGARRVGLAV